MSEQGLAGEAKIEGDEIVFRVPIAFLPDIVEGAEDSGKVTDAAISARELLTELNHEDETGSTPFHRMFDECISEAINQGAEGIELENEDED